MPSTLSYPGVYIEELPSGVHTITGVPTSITAFVGRAWRGPMNEPTVIDSWAEYERTFGGLWRSSAMSYAVSQFFQNGGGRAVIVRVATLTGAGAAAQATINLGGGNRLQAASEGTWGRNLTVAVDYKTRDETDTTLFNVTIVDDETVKSDSAGVGGSGAREVFRNLSNDATDPRFITTILAQQSQLVRVAALGTARPAETTTPIAAGATSGADGVSTTTQNGAASEINGSQANKTGMYALLKTDIFNLLCIPPLTTSSSATTPPTTLTDVPMATWAAAATFCQQRRALLLVDAPSAWTPTSAAAPATGVQTFSALGAARRNAAIYFPALRLADPLQDGALADFAPAGAVAGVMSRTDNDRGVWKAPAGIGAGLAGVMGTSVNSTPVTLTEGENGSLNPLGVNCIRTLPNIGTVVWGARTLEGADAMASDWKYVPVRRTALYIEESLYRGTQWVVFEPNDEPLWAQIRLNVGAFMHGMFRQGAFQGTSPREAYLVKCDKETTTQADINRGVVNILVGFAPLKPAEFVVIQIQQLAGQIQT